MDIDALTEALFDREGGHVALPTERGGDTCYGITQAVARGGR